MNAQPILEFLSSRPALSIRALAKACNFNPNQWYDFIAGHKPNFPDQHTWALACELCRYGLEIDGWRFTYDAETGSLFIEKPVGEPAEVIEHENEGGTRSRFEYRVPMSRDVITGPADLAGFLDGF